MVRRIAALPLAATCFFLSGAAALLYEVVWTRLLGLVFGHTVHAVTTVLAAYMAGLALGSFLAGSRADAMKRPLRAYALLEAAIGLWCLATPLLFRLTEAAYAALHPGPAGAPLLHFALSGLVLLPPTALMGATLPILSRAVVQGRELAAAQVAMLYAVNTWGAVAGTVATGFLLLPAIGLESTVLVGVGIDFGIAALALLLGRPEAREAPEAPGPDAAPAQEPTPLQVRIALAAIGLSGAASMAYEISWTRTLALVLGSSTYAFSAMLATFLSGLALGALAVSRLLRGRDPGLGALGVVEALIALSGVALLPVFGLLPGALIALLGRTGVSHGAALFGQFGLSFLVLIAPTFLIGTTIPLAIAAVGRGVARLGRDVGAVYSANTAGTIAGSMIAGFLLVPAIGLRATVIAAGAANLACALAILLAARRPLAAAGALAAFALLALAQPGWNAKMMTAGAYVYAGQYAKAGPEAVRAARERSELLFYDEGISTTVAVVRSRNGTSLSVNGKTDAGNMVDMRTQLLLGHLGALLHPAPRRALVIGLASGVTAGALAQHPLERIDVAELEPAMRQAARFFESENRGVLGDPRLRVLDGDGRHVLAAAGEPYDLIVSEPSNPWIAGVASLFTREFYQSARRHLAPDGVMVQWLQVYSIFPRDMQMVARTFQQVFPHVSVWTASYGDVLLVATPGPPALDPGRVQERLARSSGLRDDFRRFGWASGELAFRFLLDDEGVRRFAAGAPLNTDDLPLLEFSAPRALYGVDLYSNYQLLRSAQRADRPAGTSAPGSAERLRAALGWVREGRPLDAAVELSRAGMPGTVPLQAERARLLFLVSRFDEALPELSRLAPLDATARRYFRVLAALAEQPLAARVTAALQPAGDAWFADPGLLGEIALDAGGQGADPDFAAVALEQLDVAVLLAPGVARWHAARGIALLGTGLAGPAEGELQRAVELEPRDARLRLNLGAMYQRVGQIDAAQREYAEAARLAPSWEAPRQRLSALGVWRPGPK